MELPKKFPKELPKEMILNDFFKDQDIYDTRLPCKNETTIQSKQESTTVSRFESQTVQIVVSTKLSHDETPILSGFKDATFPKSIARNEQPTFQSIQKNLGESLTPATTTEFTEHSNASVSETETITQSIAPPQKPKFSAQLVKLIAEEDHSKHLEHFKATSELESVYATATTQVEETRDGKSWFNYDLINRID